MNWRFGDCELDSAARELRRGGRFLPLAPKAFRLLELLLERHPAAVSRQEIRDALWPDVFVSESNLASLVWEVRTAIGDDSRGRFVRTVRGFGYAFSGTVEPRETSSAASGAVTRLVWGDRAFPLQSGENILGRGTEAVVCLDAASISRRHARILVQGSRATLEDLGSKNGTRLNDEPVRGVRQLEDGDEIRVGTVLLLFRSLPSDSATATEPR